MDTVSPFFSPLNNIPLKISVISYERDDFHKSDNMIVSNNPVMKNVRGTLGRTVYCRQQYGKTVMCNMPRKPDKSKETDAQRATRQMFKEAVHYAKTATKDPGLKAYYRGKADKLGLPNAYTAALTDYMRKGKIESVSRKRYTGKIGGEIAVVVRKKDFAVREVAVSLWTVDGQLIEKGLAVRNKTGNWIYKNSVAVKDARAVVLQIRAMDTNGRAVE